MDSIPNCHWSVVSLSVVLSSLLSHRSSITTFFFFNVTATTDIYTLSLHDALPIYRTAHDRHAVVVLDRGADRVRGADVVGVRSEEHTSELQSHHDLVCRLLLEKKKIKCLSEILHFC